MSLTDTCQRISFCFAAAILFSTKLCKYMSGKWRWKWRWRWRCHAKGDVNWATTTNEDQRGLIYFIFMYTCEYIGVPEILSSWMPLIPPPASATAIALGIQPSTLGPNGKHSWPGKLQLRLQLRLGFPRLSLANTFFAPQKCWRRFVVHLETWGRPSAAGCCKCCKEKIKEKRGINLACSSSH